MTEPFELRYVKNESNPTTGAKVLLLRKTDNEPGCTEWCPSAATPFNLRLVSQAALDHCRAQD